MADSKRLQHKEPECSKEEPNTTRFNGRHSCFDGTCTHYMAKVFKYKEIPRQKQNNRNVVFEYSSYILYQLKMDSTIQILKSEQEVARDTVLMCIEISKKSCSEHEAAKNALKVLRERETMDSTAIYRKNLGALIKKAEELHKIFSNKAFNALAMLYTQGADFVKISTHLKEAEESFDQTREIIRTLWNQSLNESSRKYAK